MADSPYSLWIDAFIDRIEESLKGFVAECPSYDDIANSISMQDGFADISTSIAFRVAKKEKMNPDEIAAKIAGAISGMDNVESVSCTSLESRCFPSKASAQSQVILVQSERAALAAGRS